MSLLEISSRTFPLICCTCLTIRRSFRRWYGDNEYVINWGDNGQEVKNFKGSNIRNQITYLRPGMTWSTTSSGPISIRWCIGDYVYDSKGSMAFANNKDDSWYILGAMNTKVYQSFMQIITPTIDYNPGPVSRGAIIYKEEHSDIDELVKKNIALSKCDWDSFETSWDFKEHPLIRNKPFTSEEMAEDLKHHIHDMNQMSEAYRRWKDECYVRFTRLKKNEEELNRIFIDIYGLQDELTLDVADKDITVHRIFDTKDDVPESMQGSKYVRTKHDEIVSFISYAVGCMFGRYSLYKNGLIFAGEPYSLEAWVNKMNDQPGTISHEELVRAYCNEGVIVNEMFFPDEDNIIPICDDEYFKNDDIVGRFVDFVETVYGADTLDENLQFIADALGGKGQPKAVIRKYFLNDFYKDHCKMYQKRPIYWLFDSGKKNGFKCLIYMHRYQPDTIARIRTDYVHEQQARYRTAIADREQRIANAPTGERVKLKKELTALQAQDTEIRTYEEKIHHLADQMISIDLDDGVKKNYAIFKDVLAKIK